MKKVILYIDTSNSQKTVVAIVIDEKRKEFVEDTKVETKSQNVLPLIEKALKELQLSLKDIAEIKVHPGPGSFTGTRVGVSVANALGWVLQIPVNGKKVELPQYAVSKFDV